MGKNGGCHASAVYDVVSSVPRHHTHHLSFNCATFAHNLVAADENKDTNESKYATQRFINVLEYLKRYISHLPDGTLMVAYSEYGQ
eukprot:scaffold20791_cov48-Attheya_sp.AAC.5